MNLDLEKILGYFKNFKLSLPISFGTGFLVCLYLFKGGCIETPTKTEVIDNGGWVEHHVDTIYQEVIKEVPVPTYVYRKVTELPGWVQDSLSKKTWVQTDTIYVDEEVAIGINHYEDSIATKDYELKWKAETFGYLTSMVPSVTVFKDSIVCPEPILVQPKHTKFAINAGVSVMQNKQFELGAKFGVGYKGWMVETSLNKEFELNNIYLTKTFNF